MLYLFFSLIGIGLVIGIITLPFVGLFVILRGKKEFSCLSCGMLSRRYPPLSMEAGFRMRCGYCGQKTLIPSNSPTAQQVMAGSVTPLVTPFVPSVPRPRRSRSTLYLLLIFGVSAAIWFIIIVANAPTSVPTTPAATTAEPAKPTQDNAPQTPQATDNEATQTPDGTREDKQIKLGADAMVTAWQGTPVAFNERENLRFDAVVVMPDDTVCLSIHDAHPFPGVEEPNALVSLQVVGVPSGRRLYPVSDVSFDLWTRECVNQQGGVDVEPEILDRFNQIQQHMDELNQRLHNSQQ